MKAVRTHSPNWAIGDQVIALRDEDGMDYDQIARTVGVSAKQCKRIEKVVRAYPKGSRNLAAWTVYQVIAESCAAAKTKPNPARVMADYLTEATRPSGPDARRWFRLRILGVTTRKRRKTPPPTPAAYTIPVVKVTCARPSCRIEVGYSTDPVTMFCVMCAEQLRGSVA